MSQFESHRDVYGPHPQVLIHFKSEWFQKLLVAKSAIIYLLVCVNIVTFVFPLEALSNINTWSHFGYVLSNALPLPFAEIQAL